MLAASEFSIGFIGSAEALTLVLPAEKYDQAFLVVPAADDPIAIFLSGEHQFLAFPSSGNESYKGILVPSVSVEMDVTSVDISSFNFPGAMVRRRDGLFMAARFALFRLDYRPVRVANCVAPFRPSGSNRYYTDHRSAI
jgi:hypothetical protein